MSAGLLAGLVACLAGQAPVQDLIPEHLDQAWSGDADIWSIEDGELVGRSTEPQPRSHYLYWKGEAADFELRFDYLIRGGNSGVQYRTGQVSGGEGLVGYQADIEDGPNYTGILYETGGRGITATRGQALRFDAEGQRVRGASLGTAEALQEHIRSGEWNSYRIVALGDRLIHEINGVRMIDVVDRHPQHARATGTFAVQLHAGPPMEVRFRAMHLRDLSGQDPEILLGPWPSAPDQELTPHWIWTGVTAADNERRWFVRGFELKQPAEVLGGVFAGDNHHRVFVDGRPHGGGNDWSRPAALPAGMKLEPGWHGIVVEAWNDAGVAGLVGRVDLLLADGERRSIVTDRAWQVFGTEPTGWPTPELNPDAADALAIHDFGPHDNHSGPWSDVLAPRVAPSAAEIQVAPGFVVERLYSAQFGDGSWASMTFGAGGALYVSPEAGPVRVFDVSPLLGQAARAAGPGAAPGVHVAGLQPPRPLAFPVHSAQGMEWAHGALYVNVAAAPEGDGGLHRLRDTDGDGRFDEHRHLARYGPRSEHGAHGIRVGPDGALYLIHGNYTKPPQGPDGQDVLLPGPVTRLAEDVLLERHWDPRGHAHGIMAPAGVLYRTDPDGKAWQRIAVGMRNPYDIAISASGEIFTYDADMEWDLGMPWYRSPRVLHLLPGGEYGWRSGSAKWPAEYPDSLPPVLETDLASPVGVELGEGSAFPAPYQQALFLGDWAWGRITLAQLTPDGASYSGRDEEFLQGRGVAVTDLEFGPDGNLWFVIGGRGTQSGLYRVRPLEPNPQPSRLAEPPRRAERDAVLAGSDEAVKKAIADDDRTLGYLARLHLERDPNRAFDVMMAFTEGHPALQNPAAWSDRVGLAIARTGDQFALAAMREMFRVPESDDTEVTRRDWERLRTAMLTEPGLLPLEQAYFPKLREQFPTGAESYDREVARLLVANHAIAPDALLPFLDAQHSQETQIHYALLLAEIADELSELQAIRLLLWERQAAAVQGGLSAGGFIGAIAQRAREKLRPEIRATAEERLATLPPQEPPARIAVGRDLVREWTLAELETALAAAGPGDAAVGAKIFGQALCIQCHRIAGQGGAMGPDLTAASRRFSRRDLLEAILDPMKDRSDQYGLLTMPEGLLDRFTAEEIADLLAYLEAAR